MPPICPRWSSDWSLTYFTSKTWVFHWILKSWFIPWWCWSRQVNKKHAFPIAWVLPNSGLCLYLIHLSIKILCNEFNPLTFLTALIPHWWAFFVLQSQRPLQYLDEGGWGRGIKLQSGNMAMIFGTDVCFRLCCLFSAIDGHSPVPHQFYRIQWTWFWRCQLWVMMDVKSFMGQVWQQFQNLCHGALHGFVFLRFLLFLLVVGINALFERRIWKYIMLHWAIGPLRWYWWVVWFVHTRPYNRRLHKKRACPFLFPLLLFHHCSDISQ